MYELKLTSVDQLGLVTALQVVEDGGVVKVGQVDHVITLLELRRVHLTHSWWGEGFFLKYKQSSLINYIISRYIYESY